MEARRPIALGGVFLAYILIAEAGLALAGHSSIISPFSPAGGVALAALIVLGPSSWPAVFAASVAFTLRVTDATLFSLVAGAVLAFAAVAGAVLVERFASGREAFSSVRSALRGISLLAAVSLLPALTLAIFGAAAGEGGFAAFVRAWLGQVTGILVVLPAALAVTRQEFVRPNWPVVAEGGALFLSLGIAALAVFAGFTPAGVKTYPLEFLCLPFLLWAAFRFGPREVLLAVALLSGIAVGGTVRQLGPFAGSAPAEAVALLQAYLAVMAVTGIAFAIAFDERRRAEAQLQELATTDPLTGLVNHRRLLDVMRQEMARSRRTGRSFAVLLVDMDGLKKINDRHGHLAGSRALCRVAEALRRCTRETDVVSRFGGDEFAVVLPESGDEGGPAVLARVAHLLSAEPASPAVSVCGGHAVYPRDGDSPTLLLREADRKLHDAKSAQAQAQPAQTALAETG